MMHEEKSMRNARAIGAIALTVLAVCAAVCARDAGTLVGWGINYYGDWVGQAIPPDGNDFVAVNAGAYHSLGLRSDGSIVGWGANYDLLGDWLGQATPPTGNDFAEVAAGYDYSLALKTDGSIVGWGWDEYDQATPPVGNGFVAIAAGYYHGLGLKVDGSIVGWGSNVYGQATPPAGNGYVAIAAGDYYSLALKSDGSIVGWGLDYLGAATPPAGNDFVAIAAGRSHSLALKSDGSIVGWGGDGWGQATPPTGNDFVAIAGGRDHSLAIKSNGSVVAWGLSPGGERPPAGNHFVSIAAGEKHSVAIAAGRLVGWWKLDEAAGDIAADSSGYGNDGTLIGGPQWVDGVEGGAIELDGIDDYIDCGNDASLDMTAEITIAAWVKTNDAANGEHNPFITKGDHSYGLKHYSQNSIEFFVYDGSWWQTARFPIDDSFNGVWHHLAGTYDGGRAHLRLFVDGTLQASTPYPGLIAGSENDVNIGRNSEMTDRHYDGLIDDVRIYNYALDESEIVALASTKTCGDAAHPYPVGDLNKDCYVNYRDLALFCEHWLECTAP
jgi:alpha-tubulin suppressor-like RCC1 family protein